MTIESPAKSLEGGAECLPPGENLVASPVPTSPPATGSSTDASVDETGVRRTPKRKRHKARVTKARKKVAKGKPQRKNSLEGTDTSIVQDELPNDISSDMVIGEAGSSGEEVRTKRAVVSPSEKTDLKKSSKTKCICDASKEEAASRKSLRLKLKNGRIDFSNGNNDLRPRDFENLGEIDFNDRNHQTIFMDALELCRLTKKSTTEEKTVEKVVCTCHSGSMLKGPVQENPAIALTGTGLDDGTDGIRPPSHWTTQVGEKETFKEAGESQHVPRHQYQLRASSKPSCSKRLIYRDHSESEDNDGWESWVDKLPVAEWSVKTESPSSSEIRDSLKRLINLGTEIKLISPSS